MNIRLDAAILDPHVIFRGVYSDTEDLGAMTRHEFRRFGPRSCTALRPSRHGPGPNPPGDSGGEEGNQQVKSVPLRPGVLKVKAFQGDQSISQHLTSRRAKKSSEWRCFFWECCWIWDFFKGFWGHDL